MKHIVSFLLLALFASYSLSNLVFFAEYYCNTSIYVASCENKLNQSLHCEGKCQLYKQLGKDQERKESNKKIGVTEKSPFFCKLNETINYQVFEEKHKTFLSNNLLTIERPRSVFHPPGII